MKTLNFKIICILSLFATTHEPLHAGWRDWLPGWRPWARSSLPLQSAPRAASCDAPRPPIVAQPVAAPLPRPAVSWMSRIPGLDRLYRVVRDWEEAAAGARRLTADGHQTLGDLRETLMMARFGLPILCFALPLVLGWIAWELYKKNQRRSAKPC